MSDDYDRFMSKTQRSDNGCLIWKAGKYPNGYGMFWFESRNHSAHRWIYEYYNGEIGNNKLFVCHKCDTPVCVEISHLFLGTQTDNLKDCYNKQRRVSPYGKGEKHPNSILTEEQVKFIKENYVPRHKDFGTRALSRKFNVGQKTISDLLNNKSWRYLNV